MLYAHSRAVHATFISWCFSCQCSSLGPPGCKKPCCICIVNHSGLFGSIDPPASLWKWNSLSGLKYVWKDQQKKGGLGESANVTNTLSQSFRSSRRITLPSLSLSLACFNCILPKNSFCWAAWLKIEWQCKWTCKFVPLDRRRKHHNAITLISSVYIYISDIYIYIIRIHSTSVLIVPPSRLAKSGLLLWRCPTWPQMPASATRDP